MNIRLVHHERRNPNSALRAMTLVELLVAMAILLVIVSSTWIIFQSITKAWRGGTLKTERYQQARLLLDLFNRELSSAVLNDHYPFVGVRGGQGPPLKPGGIGDEVFFVGSLPGRTGLVERGYWLKSNGEFECHDDEPADGDYAATGTDERCGIGVWQFQASYFDGHAWLPQWDGRVGGPQAGQIPKAVRLLVTIGQQGGESFETIVYLPTS